MSKQERVSWAAIFMMLKIYLKDPDENIPAKTRTRALSAFQRIPKMDETEELIITGELNATQAADNSLAIHKRFIHKTLDEINAKN